MKNKKTIRAIVLADELLPTENIENYGAFLELYNGLINGNNIYEIDWTEDFYYVNLNKLQNLINTIDEIVSKTKPSDVLFISQTIYDDIQRYCDNVDSYFELLCRMRRRMIVVSNLLAEMSGLNHIIQTNN